MQKEENQEREIKRNSRINRIEWNKNRGSRKVHELSEHIMGHSDRYKNFGREYLLGPKFQRNITN